MPATAAGRTMELPKPGLRDWLGPLRLPFVLLAPVCVGLGVAVAHWQEGAADPVAATLAVVGAAAAMISVNALNEYFDFRSGLDAHTQRTPFSGGSGTLQRYPTLAGYTLKAGVATLLLSCAIGLYFVQRLGAQLLPLGFAGILLAATYSQWIVRHPLLSLIAPGLGIGPLMVMGTAFVVSGHYSAASVAASSVPFFLGNNLLLLNQFPDVDADRFCGRRNLPILWGRPRAALVLAAFTVMAYLSLAVSVMTGLLPRWALLGLLGALPAGASAIGARRHADHIPSLLPAMALNVLCNLATPVLMAVGMVMR